MFRILLPNHIFIKMPGYPAWGDKVQGVLLRIGMALIGNYLDTKLNAFITDGYAVPCDQLVDLELSFPAKLQRGISSL